MSIKSDKWIKKMSLKNKMIDPFVDTQIKEDSISFGLSNLPRIISMECLNPRILMKRK